ncbi:MAG TPA: hypothetical protein VGB53_07795 [Rubricoccaceae bacterium]|jgi:hypothetical protein
MRLLTLALALLAAGQTAAPAAQTGRWDRLAASDSVLALAGAAYAGGRPAEAGPLYLAGAEGALAASRPGALYNGACSFALAGQPDAAVQALASAIAAGWDDADWMQADTDLASLRGRTEWTGLVARAAANRVALRARQTSVDSVRIVTEDIPRFWAAVDAAGPALAAHDTSAAAAVFERLYLDPGTDQLLSYVSAKVGGPRVYAAALMRWLAYYASLRANTLALAALEPEIRGALRRMTALTPDAVFPTVGLVVGVFSSGGTSTPQGLLLGVEMNTAAPDSPRGEMPVGLQGILAPAENLPHVVVHELVHANQGGGEWSLLRGAIIEGGADFIAALALPGAPPAPYTTWGRAHDQAVWTRFMAEKDRTDTGAWIGNASFRAADWTGDLGYYVGAEICRGYYAQAADKAQAVRDLLLARDPEAILAASGYAARYAPDAVGE